MNFFMDEQRVTAIDIDTFAAARARCPTSDTFVAQTAIMGFHVFKSFAPPRTCERRFWRQSPRAPRRFRKDRVRVHVSFAFLQKPALSISAFCELVRTAWSTRYFPPPSVRCRKRIDDWRHERLEQISHSKTEAVLRVFGPFVKPYRAQAVFAYIALAASVGMTLLKPWPLKLILDSVILEKKPITEAIPLLPSVVGALGQAPAAHVAVHRACVALCS